jgi:hypothetical protein
MKIKWAEAKAINSILRCLDVSNKAAAVIVRGCFEVENSWTSY